MSYFVLPKVNLHINETSLRLLFSDSILPTVSLTLQDYLTSMKCLIDDYLPIWDIFKKYTNPYEYIHTPIPGHKHSISQYKPLSRSFFKMIEILNVHRLIDEYKTGPIKTFHLAEGPGGFIEAVRYRRANLEYPDIFYGMTLIDPDEHVPGWKKSSEFVSHPDVCIEAGADGTGNLMHIENFDYCCDLHGGQMELVTGDGGFDFSVNFNEQEQQATKLVFAQMIYGIMMQKKHGSFVLKIFDMFNRTTLEMVYILCSLYKKVMIYKPYTSRYANSERYIVCIGFLRDSCEDLRGLFRVRLHEMIETSEPLQSLLDKDMSLVFVSKVEEINAILGQYQIENIKNTMNLIDKHTPEKLESIKKNNIQKCVSWCSKQNIPYTTTFNVKSNIFLSAP